MLSTNRQLPPEKYVRSYHYNYPLKEIRGQFQIPGFPEGKFEPEYAHVVDLITSNCLKSMVGLTLVTILVPVIISFLLRFWQLTSYLPAVTAFSMSLASFRFDAGATLNNSIRSVEKGAYDGKEPTSHAAAVIGDTFGDPILYTSALSLNARQNFRASCPALFCHSIPVLVIFCSSKQPK